MSTVLPATALIRQNDTHRLILSKYSGGGDSVLVRIANDDEHLRNIFELDDATNDRQLAEHGRLPGIGPHELIFGVPYFRIVNAAFTHAHPLGSRFNGPDRGAWYTAFDLKTSQAEVAFHKTTEYTEIGRYVDSVTYDDYRADFSAILHTLRGDERLAACLAPDSYVASQELAEALLVAGSLGLVYPSVRRAGGTCLACFAPALVANVRKGSTYRFAWTGTPKPTVTKMSA